MDNDPAYQPTQPRRYESAHRNGACTVNTSNITYYEGEALLQLPADCTPVPQKTASYGDPKFINNLTKAIDLNLVHSLPGWKYKNRQTAQEILPFLFLGPMSFARDPDQVRQAGITMLVAVRSKMAASKAPNMLNPARYPSSIGLQTATFDVDTDFDMRIGRHAIIKAINDHLISSCVGQDVHGPDDITGKVLIFCETGNERSPVLVAMYLMVMWGLDGLSACQLVQARRFGIGIQPEMVSMLKDLGELFEAEKQVAKTIFTEWQNKPFGGNRKMAKRNIDEIDDMETDMNTGGDVDTMETFRPGNAPFSDIYSK